MFVDQGVLLGEDSCAWARLTGQWDNQWARDGDPGYAVSGTTYRIGGQTAIAPGWFLGGTLATGNSWASEAGGSTSTGQTFDGSVAIKHTIGHWLFAGSFAVATGSFHNDRLVSLAPAGTLPAASALLQSDSNMYLAGGRVRAAYDFTFGDLYFRPYADFDVIYAGTPGFQESGAAGYALNVHDTSKTTVAISPELEFGGRYNTDQNTILRPFVAIGVNFIPNNTRTVDANFVGASAYDGSFTTYMKSPNVLGNLDVGFQLYREGGFEVRTEYTLHAGSGFLSQSASGRIAYHF